MRNAISGRLLAATALVLVYSAAANAADNGLESSDGTLVTNPFGSSIEGDRKGIYSYGATFNLDNAGTIRGNGTAGGVTSPDGGVVIIGGPADVTNSGTISGQRFGLTTGYFFNSGTGLFEGRATNSMVDNSGSIIGDTDDGVRLQGGGSVTNSGYIAGRVGAGADGISIFPYDDQDMTGIPRAGSVTNLLGGVVEGNRYGIILSGGGTVDNAGTVSGNTGGVLIQTQANDPGRTGSLTNSGTINGFVGFFSLVDATLENSGTITSTTGAAVDSNGPLSVTNTSTGSITGGTRGIQSTGSSLTVDNAGTIRGNGASRAFDAADAGIVITGGAADISNSGTISGQAYGITTLPFGTEGRAIGSTIDNSGSIIGDNDDGIRLRGGGTVVNSGYIAGRASNGADGISMFAFDGQDLSAFDEIGSVTNLAGGVIEGFRFGIILSNGGTVTNAGTITGFSGGVGQNTGGILIQAVLTDPGRIGTISNSGTINGGVSDFGLAEFNITNEAAGLITSTTIGVLGAGATMTLDNAGTIRGNGTSSAIDDAHGGVVVSGGPAIIANSGSISGTRYGITTLPFNGEGRAIGSSVTNSGSIIGDNDDGIRLRGGGTVVNSGYIAGRTSNGADGISMFSFDDQDLTAFDEIGSVTNLSGGVIEGFRFGIILSNGGTVTNAGTITGSTLGIAQNRGGIHIQAPPNDPGRIGSVTNSGTINGGVSAFGLAAMDVTNESSGSIAGATDGINSASASFTLDNAGTIRGNGTSGLFDTANAGVVLLGGPADITNSGTISGARYGITTQPLNGVGLATDTSVTNSGSIIGDNDDGIRLRGGGTVVNSGYIAGRATGGADGISMFTYDDQALPSGAEIGSVANLAGGTIEGNRFGIILSNGGTVSNAGTITGFSGAPAQNTGGVHLQAQPTDPGRVGSVTNSGTINGGVSFFGLASSSLNNSGTISSAGLAVLSNSATSLLNSGTLAASGGTAVQLSDFADSVTLQTGSSIAGVVDGGLGSDSLTLSGSISTKTSQQSIGSFANFESLNVLGGYWTAAGATGTFGSTTVSGGTFAVDGTITSPITVASGAVLGGVGTITGNVTVNSGGVFSPGNSIGTSRVTGNVNLASGSTFRVETTAAGLSDLLAVTGSVTLGSGSALQVLGGTGDYGPRTAYTILTATGGINGKFGTVTTDLAFLSPQVATKSGSIVLTLTRNSKPIRGAATLSTFGTADAVAGLNEGNPIHSAILGQSVAGARQAFSELSGSGYGRLNALIADDFGRASLALTDTASNSPKLRWSGMNGIASTGVNGGSARSFGPISMMMVGGAYASHLSSEGLDADVYTRFVSGGVGYRSGRFQALAGASSAWHDVEVSRSVSFPGFSESSGSHYAAQTHRIDIEAAYALTRGKVAVSPYGGYSHILAQSPGFQETGGFASLAFDKTSQSVDQMRLGLRMGSDFKVGSARLSPHLEVALEQVLGDVGTSGSAHFASGSSDFGELASGFNSREVNIDGGLDLRAGPVTLTGRYQARLGDRWTDHSASVGASLRF